MVCWAGVLGVRWCRRRLRYDILVGVSAKPSSRPVTVSGPPISSSLSYSDSLSPLTSLLLTARYELVLKLNGKWLLTDNFVFLSTSLIMFLLVLKNIN